MNLTSMMIVLFLSGVPLLGRVSDVKATNRTWPISGTAYAVMLDGTVLAQYNFSDEVVVAADPTGANQLKKPIRRLANIDWTEHSVFQQLSAYDAMGTLVGREANVTRLRFFESLDRRRNQLLFVIAVDYQGNVHRLVTW